jgi:hypothetical protein
MKIIIIAEEKVSHKVGFLNDVAMTGLGHLLHVFLDKGVDTLVVIPTLIDLDEVTMVANMNARSMSGIIAVEVEDFGNAW